MRTLEKLVRRYSNLPGLYITAEQEAKEQEGQFYTPIFSDLNPITQRQTTRLRRLLAWALG